MPLGQLGIIKPCPCLLDFAIQNVGRSISSVDALGMIGDPLSIDALADKIKDKNPKVGRMRRSRLRFLIIPK